MYYMNTQLAEMEMQTTKNTPFENYEANKYTTRIMDFAVIEEREVIDGDRYTEIRCWLEGDGYIVTANTQSSAGDIKTHFKLELTNLNDAVSLSRHFLCSSDSI